MFEFRYKKQKLSGGFSKNVHTPWNLVLYSASSSDAPPSVNETISMPLNNFKLTPEALDEVYIFWYHAPTGSTSENLYICAGNVTDVTEETVNVRFQHVTLVSGSTGVQSDTIDIISALSQEELDTIPTKDKRTLYVIKG